MKVVTFARVSTNLQDYERQVNELAALGNATIGVLKLLLQKKCQGQRKMQNGLNCCG